MAKDKEEKKGLTIKMTLGRETKGTHVYKNEDANTAVKSLYISRDAITGTPPETITLRIEGL